MRRFRKSPELRDRSKSPTRPKKGKSMPKDLKSGNPEKAVYKKLWKGYGHPSIIGRMNSLFMSTTMSDVEFDVSFKEQHEVMPAHSIILSMASPVFYAQFYGPNTMNKDSDGLFRIPIIDIEPSIFRRLLHFIYTDKIRMRNPADAFEMIYAANKYTVITLVKMCRMQMSIGLRQNPQDFGYLFRVIQMATRYKFDELKDEALLAIESVPYERCIDHDEFFELDNEELQLVVSHLWKVASHPQHIFGRIKEYTIHHLETTHQIVDDEKIRECIADVVDALDLKKFDSRNDVIFMLHSGMISEAEKLSLLAKL